MSKPTMSGASKKRENTCCWVRRDVHRTDGESKHIRAPAFHSTACKPGSACHSIINDCPGPRYAASPWIPSDPTRKTPYSSVSLAGHHQNSDWERKTVFGPPVQCSNWSQMSAMLHWRQQTLAEIPQILYSRCPSVPALLWKPASLSWHRYRERTGGPFFSNPAALQPLGLR